MVNPNMDFGLYCDASKGYFCWLYLNGIMGFYMGIEVIWVFNYWNNGWMEVACHHVCSFLNNDLWDFCISMSYKTMEGSYLLWIGIQCHKEQLYLGSGILDFFFSEFVFFFFNIIIIINCLIVCFKKKQIAIM